MNSFFHPCCQKRQTNHEYNCLSMLSNKIRQLSPAVKINLQNQLYKTLSRLISTKTEVLINLPCKYGKKFNQSLLNIFQNFIFILCIRWNLAHVLNFGPYENLNCRKSTKPCPIKFKLGNSSSLNSLTNFQKLDLNCLHLLKFGTPFNFQPL